MQEIIGASQGRLLYGALFIPNMVMAFEGDYFQQSIGVIMGTDAAPILAIIYMARLENLLKEKYKTNERILGHFYLKDLLMTLLDYKSK